MHDTAALLLESVENSIEAGARHINALVEIESGKIGVRVEDDGEYNLLSDPFEDGSTTKGEGRGRGLHIIKERSEGRCRLTRGWAGTVLEYAASDDGSFDDLYEALLPVFCREESITITIKKDGRDISVSRKLLEERDAVPDRAGCIKRFRELLSDLEKGEIYG